MNKKMIRNTLLLLLIPLLISMVISIINLRKNSFSTSVNYDNNSVYVENYEDIEAGENVIDSYNRSYPIILFSAITLIIIFGIFYIYLTHKKGW